MLLAGQKPADDVLHDLAVLGVQLAVQRSEPHHIGVQVGPVPWRLQIASLVDDTAQRVRIKLERCRHSGEGGRPGHRCRLAALDRTEPRV